MQVSSWISAVLVGIVVGTLGRLALPGRQNIGNFVTVLIGIAAGVAGAFIAKAVGVATKAPVTFVGITWHWYVLAIQVGLAVIGTAIATAISHSRIADPAPTRKRR